MWLNEMWKCTVNILSIACARHGLRRVRKAHSQNFECVRTREQRESEKFIIEENILDSIIYGLHIAYFFSAMLMPRHGPLLCDSETFQQFFSNNFHVCLLVRNFSLSAVCCICHAPMLFFCVRISLSSARESISWCMDFVVKGQLEYNWDGETTKLLAFPIVEHVRTSAYLTSFRCCCCITLSMLATFETHKSRARTRLKPISDIQILFWRRCRDVWIIQFS